MRQFDISSRPGHCCSNVANRVEVRLNTRLSNHSVFTQTMTMKGVGREGKYACGGTFVSLAA
jgi:hypothetical protein